MAVGEAGVDVGRIPGIHMGITPFVPIAPPKLPTPMPPASPPDTSGSSRPSGAAPMPVVSTTTSGSTKTETRYRTTKIQETVVHTLTDNGAGAFGGFGTANYAGKSLNVRLVSLDSKTDGYKSDYERSTSFDGATGSADAQKGGEYQDNTLSEELLATSTVSVAYSTGTGSEVANTSSYAPPAVTIDLCPQTSDYVVPGSVRFTWMGHVFEDYDGTLIRDRGPGDVGFAAGQVNYTSGVATVTDYVVDGGPENFTLDSLWTIRQNWNTASVFMRTDVAPLKPTGFVMQLVDSQGNAITGTSDVDGNVTGTHLKGRIEYQTGEVEMQFGDYVLDTSLTDAQKAEWWYDPADVGAVQADKIWRPWPVDPTTLRYSCVSYVYLPVDASLMGVDPAALPPDGRVAFARPGDTCVVGMTHGGPAFAPSVGMTYDVGHERLSFLQVLNDATGAEILTGYTTDLDAGTATFTDLTDYPALVKVVARTEQYRQIAEVRIDGKVKLTQPIGHEFPVGAVLSTALRQGDRFARVRNVFDQASWDGTTWADAVDATAGPAPSTYNAAQYPVQVANRGAITERWALRFRSGGQLFDLIGEHLGQIASGDINADFSPMNLAAGAPYFTLPAAGWGAGWVAGNVLFLDTVGAEFAIDLLRCTQPSSPAGVDDSFWLVQRGDVGRAPESEF